MNAPPTRLDSRTLLADILRQRSYRRRQPPEPQFVLASGRLSWHYFDCDRTTSYGLALPLIGELVHQRLHLDVTAIGGPTRGADPIASATAYYHSQYRHGYGELDTFSIRNERKGHGIPSYIEGVVERGDRVALVDDVLTSGLSLITALQRCASEGLRVAQVIVLVDRQEGGLERVQDEFGEQVQVEAIFRHADLLDSK